MLLLLFSYDMLLLLLVLVLLFPNSSFSWELRLEDRKGIKRLFAVECRQGQSNFVLYNKENVLFLSNPSSGILPSCLLYIFE